MRKTSVVFSLAVGVLAAATSWAAVLENPGTGQLYSGIGVISGWKCQAEGDLTIVFNDDGQHIPLLYGAARPDVRANGQCLENADDNVGFVTIWNWGELEDGEHEAVAYDNGVEFDRASFRVGSTGAEFLQGVTRRTVVDGFPAPGEWALLEWNESTQHFEIRAVWGRVLEGGYDQTDWRQYAEDWTAGTSGAAEFLYAEEPDLDTCRGGALTQAAKDRALEAMNRIRALHSLPPVQYSSRYDEQVQQAALIQAANSYLEHFPEPSAQCYTTAGAEGSATSNLSRSGVDVDPAWDMVGWTASAGHRRWLLNPFATHMSYGQVYGHAAQKVFGFDEEEPITPQIEVDYVAFPYQTYPFHLAVKGAPWSFSVIEDKGDLWGNTGEYFETATVSVTRVADGTSLRVSDIYTTWAWAGVGNFLSWQVAGWEYDTLYEVEIRNVSMQSGATRSYSYPVFIDRANIEY